MRGRHRILDFRNRPPLPAFESLFELKRSLLGNPLKRTALEMWFRWLTKSVLPLRNAGAATLSPSMTTADPALALRMWSQEIDAAGIDAVVCNGRLSDDRGSIDADTLARMQAEHPGRFHGLAPVNLEIDAREAAVQCERAIRALGLRGLNIEPGIRKRGGPTHVDHPDLYPIFEVASALDVPVMVYTSPFAGPDPHLANDPRPYLRVLAAFAKLVFILGHGGYPHVKEVVEAARTQPRLYVCQDIYAFWPGGGHYLRSIEMLQDQFLFGTSYPFSSMAEPVERTLRLPLSAQAMEKYLWSNGARLLELPRNS